LGLDSPPVEVDYWICLTPTEGAAMADKGDATLIVQLAQLGTSMGLQAAMRVVFSDEFDPEAANARDESVAVLLNFGETVATLTKHGLLDTELVLDWLWISGIWARVGPAARKARDEHGVVQLFENVEALAAKQG
jgi:hypothetical protein